jgi:hypothetical protein
MRFKVAEVQSICKVGNDSESNQGLRLKLGGKCGGTKALPAIPWPATSGNPED